MSKLKSLEIGDEVISPTKNHYLTFPKQDCFWSKELNWVVGLKGRIIDCRCGITGEIQFYVKFNLLTSSICCWYPARTLLPATMVA